MNSKNSTTAYSRPRGAEFAPLVVSHQAYFDYVRQERQRIAIGAGGFFSLILVVAYLVPMMLPTPLDPTWGGVIAREPQGLIGIALAPLRHLDVVHLLTNVLLGAIAAYAAAWSTTFARFMVSLPFLWLMPQVLPWFLLPEGSVLLGASGVICAFTGFAFASLLKRPEGIGRMWVAIGVFALFVVQLFLGENVSISAHLGGFVLGALVGGVWRLLDATVWRQRGHR